MAYSLQASGKSVFVQYLHLREDTFYQTRCGLSWKYMKEKAKQFVDQTGEKSFPERKYSYLELLNLGCLVFKPNRNSTHLQLNLQHSHLNQEKKRTRDVANQEIVHCINTPPPLQKDYRCTPSHETPSFLCSCRPGA